MSIEHKDRPNGGRRKIRQRKPVTAPVAPASLPLPAADGATPPPSESPASPVPAGKVRCPGCQVLINEGRHKCHLCGTSMLELKAHLPPNVRKHDDSKVHDSCLKIVALEAVGTPREEIAKILGITMNTLKQYLYVGGKNGWIDFSNPKDTIEYGIVHKALKNLDEAMSDETRAYASGMPVKTQVALKIAEGTVFKQFDTPVPAGNGTMVGVKIEIVNGEKGEVRPGTIQGADTYIEGEKVEE